MTDDTQNPGGWPDAARETVEWALAVHFSGNRMPHMSGDPRNRLSPGQRRQMEDARDAVLDALAPILAARVAAARREGIEAAAEAMSPMLRSMISRDQAVSIIRALLEDDHLATAREVMRRRAGALKQMEDER